MSKLSRLQEGSRQLPTSKNQLPKGRELEVGSWELGVGSLGIGPLLAALAAGRVVRISAALVVGVLRIGAQRTAGARERPSSRGDRHRSRTFLDPLDGGADQVEALEPRP